MPRIFLPVIPKSTEVLVSGKQVHHLLHVLRAGKGFKVSLFDPGGNECQAEITDFSKKEVRLKINKRNKPLKKSPIPKLIIAQALLKNRAWDLLLEKAMELGLSSLIPMWTERTTVRAEFMKRKPRWEKKIIAAAKQSGRNNFLIIQDLRPLKEMVTEKADIKLIAHPGDNLPTLKSVLEEIREKPATILILIGPEGGFNEREISMARAAGFTPISLSPYTLRAETAAIAAIAACNYYYA